MTHHNANELAGRIEELLVWSNTGKLPEQSKVRAYAESLTEIPKHMRMTVAERKIEYAAMEFALAALRSHPQQPQGGVVSESEPQRLTQTELGPHGNCQSVCLAMMLGLPLSAVPNFWVIGGYTSDGFVHAQREWLEKRGLFILTFSSWGQEGAVLFPPQQGYFIVGGTSPRGHLHSVIFKDGVLWHDPHPEGGGIVPDSVDFIFPIGFAALAALPSPVSEDRPSEAQVLAGAKILANSPLIDAPELPWPTWMGLSRAILEAAAPLSPVAEGELTEEERKSVSEARYFAEQYAKDGIRHSQVDGLLAIIDRLIASQSPEKKEP